MSQKIAIGLNARINEFSQKFDISRSEDSDNDVFEDFSNYIVASNLLEDELENITSVSTNKAQGIDGIIIIINGKLVVEETDLEKFGEEPLKIKVGFVQSTLQKSFDEQKYRSFVDEVVSFLTGQVKIEPFSSIYSLLFDEKHPYLDRIAETPIVTLYFLSGKTKHELSDNAINTQRCKIQERQELTGLCVLEDIYMLQAQEIEAEYNKISKFHSVQMEFETNAQLEGVAGVEISLLTTIKFSELKKLILSSDNNLKERLFVENVRNYIGNTPVNIDIKRTLDSQEQNIYFPFLNNGLVVICDKIAPNLRRNSFTLSFPRIINGCQTTHSLYRKDKEDPGSIDNIEVVAKVIATDNQSLKKKIIHAANNQNAIDKDLQSLNDYHEKIETYFLGVTNSSFRLSFERLRGQHSQVSPPYSKINIETLARVYISVILLEPHSMKSNAIKKIELMQNEGSIFNSRHDVVVYYYCGVLYYWMNHFLVNNDINFRSKAIDMHLLLVCNLFLERKENLSTSNDKIDFLKLNDNAKRIFVDAVDFVNSQEYLFERRGFYSNPKTQQLINSIPITL